MIKDHSLFIHPKDSNQKIWRYIDFTKFVDLLNSECLYFSRADKFSDLFEGSYTKKTIEEREKLYLQLVKSKKLNSKYTPEFVRNESLKRREDFAINCWHLNDYESAAMWKLYLKSNEGIAIQTSFEKMCKALTNSPYTTYAGVINYIDYENDVIDYQNVFSPYLYKRKSFAHENELRLIIWKDNLKDPLFESFTDFGIKVKLELSEFIENIYVSPDSSKWLTDLVKDTCLKFGFDFNVINSRLNEAPLF